MSNNESDGKKALLENATDLARDAQRRLYPSDRGRYQGPPSFNSGPRRPGQKMW
jgi:hypothetical protein